LCERVEAEAEDALQRGESVTVVLTQLIVNLNANLSRDWIDPNKPPEHQIPEWAWKMFGLCFLLVVVAMLAEYYIVRRGTGIRRSAASTSAAGGASGGGGAKTHMMFNK
jgi:hypothetical protein